MLTTKAFIDLPSSTFPFHPPVAPSQNKRLAAGEPAQPGHDKDGWPFLPWVPGAEWNVGCTCPEAPTFFASLRASAHPASPAFCFPLFQCGSCISSATFFPLASCSGEQGKLSDRLRGLRIPALIDSISKMLIHT